MNRSIHSIHQLPDVNEVSLNQVNRNNIMVTMGLKF